MTCIVGVQRRGFVTIGADSRGVAGLDSVDREDEKVFPVMAGTERLIIGCTSSFRMIQILRYRLELPSIDTWDVRRWMCVKFIDAARKAFSDAGWAMKDKEGADMGGNFLVGVRDQLFEIECDHQVGVPRSGLAACGCGFKYALGAMHATAETEPDRIVTVALEAASRFSAGVAPPFVILNTKPDVT